MGGGSTRSAPLFHREDRGRGREGREGRRQKTMPPASLLGLCLLCLNLCLLCEKAERCAYHGTTRGGLPRGQPTPAPPAAWGSSASRDWIWARRASSSGGSISRSPRRSAGSSTAKPGAVVATLIRTPPGPSKQIEWKHFRSFTPVGDRPRASTRARTVCGEGPGRDGRGVVQAQNHTHSRKFSGGAVAFHPTYAGRIVSLVIEYLRECVSEGSVASSGTRDRAAGLPRGPPPGSAGGSRRAGDPGARARPWVAGPASPGLPSGP